MARPAGLEPATSWFVASGKEAIGGSGTPLPLVSFGNLTTRGNPRKPQAATECQSFVSRLSGRTRDASTSWLDHNKRSLDALTKFGDDSDDGFTKTAPRIARKADQDYSRRLVTTGVGQRSEVLVFRHEYSRLRAGKSENGWILGAWTDLYDCGDVMACRTECSDHGEVTALVREKPHRLLFAIAAGLADENDFLVGKRVGRVPHRRVNVVTREPRIGVQEISFRRTFAELAKQQFHRDPCSADYRLSKHHFWINFDAVRERHGGLWAGYTHRRTPGYDRISI